MRLQIEKEMLKKASGCSWEVLEKIFQEYPNGPVINIFLFLHNISSTQGPCLSNYPRQIKTSQLSYSLNYLTVFYNVSNDDESAFFNREIMISGTFPFICLQLFFVPQKCFLLTKNLSTAVSSGSAR